MLGNPVSCVVTSLEYMILMHFVEMTLTLLTE